MDGYQLGIAVTPRTYEYHDLDSPSRQRDRSNLLSVDSQEGFCPLCDNFRLCSSTKLWIIFMSIVAGIVFFGFVLWIILAQYNYAAGWDDEGPQGPENPPAICYQCSNYAHIMDGREITDFEKALDEGSEIEGFRRAATMEDEDDPRQKLCQEIANRTALAETQVPADDDCGDSLYNGCFKMVTKSFRMIPNLGRERLSVTVVTRNCVELPTNTPLGCYKTFGGAGMEREICYCKGNYCNSADHTRGSIAASLLLYSLFNICN